MDRVLSLFGLKTTGIVGSLTLTKTGTTARTATFPDAAITVAGLEVANVFTAAQTVPDGSGAPGIRTTSEAHGFGRGSATSLRFYAAGTRAFDVGYSGSASFAIFGAASTGAVGFFHQQADGSMQLCGSTGSTVGGQVRLYGQSHATKASYVEFTRGNTVSAYFDGSGNLICSGTITVPNGTAAAPGIRTTTYVHGLYSVDASNLGFAAAGLLAASLGAPNGSTLGGSLQLRTPSAAERGLVNISLNTSYLQLASDPSLSGGGIKLYGPSHATKPNVVEFLVVGSLTASFDASGIFTTVATTDASAIGTAAIVGPGGLSIAKSIYCAGSAGQFINIANSTGELRVNGTKVVGSQGSAVADASGGATVDAEARTAINTLLARLRTHGLIAT